MFSGFSADGHPVSGSADFVLNPVADTATVTLTNTTDPTHDAGELLTGLDFSFGGLIPTLTSDTGVLRTVDGAGSFVDTMAAVDLTWSLLSQGGGIYQLDFNPNAKDAILGPPTLGSYADANGSIKGNPGHNPFVALSAVFTLSVSGLEPNTSVSVTRWRFGTNLDPAIVPEPATLALTAMGLVGAMSMRRRAAIA
jgi:hypothetical protein